MNYATLDKAYEELHDELCGSLLSRGFATAECTVSMFSPGSCSISATYRYESNDDQESCYVYAASISEAVAGIKEKFAKILSPEESRRERLAKALATAIELSNQLGLSADFVNPIMQRAKELSENAITYQPINSED